MAQVPRGCSADNPQTCAQEIGARRYSASGNSIRVRRVPTNVPVLRVIQTNFTLLFTLKKRCKQTRRRYDGSSIVLSACRYYADTKLDDARPRQERKDHRGHGIPILQGEHRLRRSGNLHTDQRRSYFLLRQVREAHRIRRTMGFHFIGICPCCHKRTYLTRHHVLPRRHFGRGKKNPQTVLLCRPCHDKLELLIPYERMPLDFYFTILPFFGILIPIKRVYGYRNKEPHYSLSAVSES